MPEDNEDHDSGPPGPPPDTANPRKLAEWWLTEGDVPDLATFFRRRLGGSPRDISDLVQESKTRFLSFADEPIEKPADLLLKIASYVARERIHANIRSDKFTVPESRVQLALSHMTDGELPSDELERARLKRRIDAALQELPATQRALVIFYYVHDMTLVEAARRCQVKPRTAEGYLRLALREMAEFILSREKDVL